jgi:hypothetical protein
MWFVMVTSQVVVVAPTLPTLLHWLTGGPDTRAEALLRPEVVAIQMPTRRTTPSTAAKRVFPIDSGGDDLPVWVEGTALPRFRRG